MRGSHRRDVAIDLDETLLYRHTQYRKWRFGGPVACAAQAVAAIRERGLRVIVHTARSNDERDAIAAHLAKHGITVDGIVCGKPPAIAYIDDKALHFAGDWQETLRELEARL